MGALKSRDLAIYCPFLIGFLLAAESFGALKPGLVHTVDGKKNEAYVRDGLFVGGDRAIRGAVIKDIRRASNSGFERLVIDLDPGVASEPVAVARPPYFHVAVSRDEQRLIFSVWGKPNLGFNSSRVLEAFKKSTSVARIELLPRMEDEIWTFAMNLRGNRMVEVFELSNPSRIIVDIKADPLKK